MGSDYNRIQIEKYEKIKNEENGVMVDVPIDQYGHYLDWEFTAHNDGCARELTSPYGILEYAVGNSEGDEKYDGDFTTFFDFAELPDGRMILHAVVNTESGGYIGDGEYVIVPKSDAPMMAEEMVANALDAVYMNEVGHDTEGWNQDPFYFSRVVKAYVNGDPTYRVERIAKECPSYDW